MARLGLIAALAAWSIGTAAADDTDRDNSRANTPPELTDALASAGLATDYALVPLTVPYLRADLDGDRRPDHVVALRSRDAVVRLAVVWGHATRPPSWLPAANAPAHDRWFWYVHPRRKPIPPGTGRPPRLRGEAIIVSEPLGTLVYWTGRRLATYAIPLAWPTDPADEP